jgi:lipoprotein-anchoring transpeptidase ErfK/SrfK
MDPKFLEARDHILKAREALRRGDKASAWKLGEQAALLAPNMEDAWLVLAASDPDPQEALAYAQKALEINPSSTRARKGVEWALGQMKQAPASVPNPSKGLNEPSASITDLRSYASVAAISLETNIAEPKSPKAEKTSNDRGIIYAAAIFGFLICAVVAFAAYSAVTHPALASILNSVPVPTQENLWAAVEIAKPAVTPIDASAFAPQAADTPTAKAVEVSPTPEPAEEPTSAPTEIPAEAASPTPEVTETPGTMAMEIVADTPTSEYVAPKSSAPLPAVAKSGNGTRWIDVDLTNQRVYAYEGDVIVNSFIVSTGTWLTPTVTGQYKIYVKYRSTKMSGPGYYLPDVPYVMYFYKGYGLHGTYWHNNFGTPMSHGCVNLKTDDAGWLYNWASVGTVVNVHY